MHRITSLDLAPFYRNSVGVDRFMESMLSKVNGANAGNYPPYNIISLSENKYRVELAIAGFAEDEIKVVAEDGQLIITGEQLKIEGTENEETYLHNGISAKNFIRTFELADYVEVRGATVEAGILKIELERIVPDNLKPKEIKINFKK